MPSAFSRVEQATRPCDELALDMHQEKRAYGAQLMVRISVANSTDETVTLLLEGQVIGDAVDELNSSCDQALAEGRSVTLDLTGVSFIDRKGVGLFHRLAARQVRVVNCSGFVAEQLKVRDPG